MVDHHDLFVKDETDVAGQKEVTAPAEIKDQKDVAEVGKQ